MRFSSPQVTTKDYVGIGTAEPNFFEAAEVLDGSGSFYSLTVSVRDEDHKGEPVTGTLYISNGVTLCNPSSTALTVSLNITQQEFCKTVYLAEGFPFQTCNHVAIYVTSESALQRSPI